VTAHPIAADLRRKVIKINSFETIVAEMNDEYGVQHVGVEDDPEDLKQDRKMVTFVWVDGGKQGI